MLCPNLNIKNNVIIKKRYVGCSSCRGTISQRLREPQPTILIFISSLMLYLMISHTFTWKKQNATTLPPRRVEKTAIAQLTASEESFNSLKLGCRELWSLVSARSDVPDLFFGILGKGKRHFGKCRSHQSCRSTISSSSSTTCRTIFEKWFAKREQSCEQMQEKLKNQKEAP